MPDPSFKLTLGVDPPPVGSGSPGTITGGLKASGAAFQPYVSLQLYDKTTKLLVGYLLRARPHPLIAGAELTWEAVWVETQLPQLPPGEYLLVAYAWGSPGSELTDEARASFTVAPPAP